MKSIITYIIVLVIGIAVFNFGMVETMTEIFPKSNISNYLPSTYTLLTNVAESIEKVVKLIR
jgi:hypothetical protein